MMRIKWRVVLRLVLRVAKGHASAFLELDLIMALGGGSLAI